MKYFLTFFACAAFAFSDQAQEYPGPFKGFRGNNFTGTEYKNAPLMDQNVIREEKKNIMVYPNPTNGRFKVETETGIEVTILNPLGEMILKAPLSAGKNEFDLAGHPNSVYYIQINDAAGIQTIRLVKHD